MRFKFTLYFCVFIALQLIGFFCSDPLKPDFTYPPEIIDDEVKTSGAKLEGSEFTMYIVLNKGDKPVNFQWIKNGAAIVGDTTDTLLFTQLKISDNGEYRCIASNKYGSDTTEVYTLLVFPDTTDSTGGRLFRLYLLRTVL